MLILDGSRGEGGGQILRTALSLSMCTGLPFRIEKIRARRKKPGLMRQHLTAVLAAAQVCGAHVEGAEIGSMTLEFMPGEIKPGDYEFAVGTAGSATLVFQTVLPALLRGATASTLVLRGGTHNSMAPPFHFLERSFVPLISKMGVAITLDLNRHGFYPAGGGEFTARINPTKELTPLSIRVRGDRTASYAESLIAGVAGHVAKRELETIGTAMGWGEDQLRIRGLPNDQGPGNALMITMEHEYVTEVVTAFGEKGTTAEAVAKKAVIASREYLVSTAAIGEHLADQLLLPMALAGSGEFTTTTFSSHAATNAEVIQKFLSAEIEVSQLPEGGHLIRVS